MKRLELILVAVISLVLVYSFLLHAPVDDALAEYKLSAAATMTPAEAFAIISPADYVFKEMDLSDNY